MLKDSLKRLQRTKPSSNGAARTLKVGQAMRWYTWVIYKDVDVDVLGCPAKGISVNV